MASSLITKKTVRGDSSVEEATEEIAAPPTDLQAAVDAKHAKLHAADHGAGQADEISLAGLSGETATPQPPKSHKASHVVGQSDAFDENDEVRFKTVKTGLTTERYTKSTTTTDDTPTDMDEIAVAEAEVVDVEVNVIARKSDGSERAIYHLEGVFYRNASGDVTQEGKTAALFVRRSTSAYKVDLEVDTGTQSVDVRITGVAATTIKWEARVIATRLQA